MKLEEAKRLRDWGQLQPLVLPWVINIIDQADRLTPEASAALLKLLEENPGFLRPDARRNEIKNRIREGLNDVPITRTGAGEWGIKVPGDAEHVIYVWIDALINYLSTVDTPERIKYWPADVHLLAKDILWFHAVIWPAMLMALKRPLPGQIYAHAFWIAEGQKMSKSLGNFVDLEKIDRYVAEYGLDAFRYFLAAYGPLGANDSDFAEAKFISVYNSELANDLGNLVNRALTMVTRYRSGNVPAANQMDLRADVEKACAAYREKMNVIDLAGALESVRGLVSRVNRYVEETAPFRLAKQPEQAVRLDAVLYNLAETVRLLSVLVAPVMPGISRRIREQLGAGEKIGALGEELRWGVLVAGGKVGKVEPLFPRKLKD